MNRAWRGLAAAWRRRSRLCREIVLALVVKLALLAILFNGLAPEAARAPLDPVGVEGRLLGAPGAGPGGDGDGH